MCWYGWKTPNGGYVDNFPLSLLICRNLPQFFTQSNNFETPSFSKPARWCYASGCWCSVNFFGRVMCYTVDSSITDNDVCLCLLLVPWTWAGTYPVRLASISSPAATTRPPTRYDFFQWHVECQVPPTKCVSLVCVKSWCLSVREWSTYI